jgi:hypothetical protein
MHLLSLLSEFSAWAALLPLVLLEIVLALDILVFIAIPSNRLPPHQQSKAGRNGLLSALDFGLVLPADGFGVHIAKGDIYAARAC